MALAICLLASLFVIIVGWSCLIVASWTDDNAEMERYRAFVAEMERYE